ncbi:MAG: methyl-accepting chemotaxis protein [Planctomycetota bacterium]
MRGRTTIGRKIGYTLALVLAILVAVAVWSVVGIGGIVKNASDVIFGNRLRGNMVQREVDHLNWAKTLNRLLVDKEVRNLEDLQDLGLQLDPHKCAFGQWYYSDEREATVRRVEELRKPLETIETPHARLHDSARELAGLYRQPHAGLLVRLGARLNEHMAWTNQVSETLAAEAGGLYYDQMLLLDAVRQAASTVRAIATQVPPPAPTPAPAMENENMDAAGEPGGDGPPPAEPTRPARQAPDPRAQALSVLREMRYGPEGTDYFFVIDTDAVCVLHPIQPELEGQDLSERTDPTGKRLFAEMARIARTDGSGFLVYEWKHPTSGKVVPKLTYVQRLDPWGWVLGTGIFLDAENEALIARAHALAAGQPFRLGVEIDPTACAFGHWMDSEDVAQLRREFPEFNTFIEEVQEPHETLHASAARIETLVNELRVPDAIRVLENETKPALAGVQQHFETVMAAEEARYTAEQEAKQYYATETSAHLQRVQELLKEIRDTAAEKVMTDEEMLSAASNTRWGVEALSIVGVLAGVLLAVFITRGIVRSLGEVIAGLRDGSEQTNAAAGQVSSASQQLAEGATEQAASLEETSSALEEMASMTRQNADNAKRASDLAGEARSAAASGNDAMGEMLQAVDAINESSSEIGKVIKVIQEIAFQTNLLALNAAVEAARAGDAGKGFAVVADEVRNLAQRSAEAARDTTALIETAVERSENGGRIAREAGTALGTIVERIREAADLVAEISTASQEQAQGIDQVNTAVAQMDKVTQSNAASAEESASASEELSAQAERLHEMVRDLSALAGASLDDTGHAGGGRSLAPAPRTAPSSARRNATPPRLVRPDEVIPMDDED